MKTHFSIFFLWLSMSFFAIGGNLQGVQSTYLQDLPCFVTKRITDLHDRFNAFYKNEQSTYLKQTRDILKVAAPKLLSLQEQILIFAKRLNTTVNAASLRNHTKQLETLRRDQVGLEQFQFPVLTGQQEHSVLCEKHLPSIFLHDHPFYRINENIRPCDRPKPEGRTTAAGEEFRTSAYLPATAVGCGAFQLFIPIPVVGCLIGVLVGAGVGAAVGEGGRAIINAEENKKEWTAYHAGCESDKQNQLADIAKAKDFTSQNPITIEGVRKKTIRACLEHASLTFIDEIASKREDFLKEREELKQEISALDLKIKTLQQTLLEAGVQENSNQIAHHRQQVLRELESLEIENEALSMKRRLIDCLLDAGNSEEAVEDCQKRAQA